MRKLIMWNVITIDGYFEGSKPWDLEFHQTVYDKELEIFIIDQLKTANMLVFGKNTYEGMADYWSKAEGEPETPFMNQLPKVVCSTSLKTAEWENTTVISDAVSGLTELKQSGDGNMFVFGSGKLSDSLMKAGLFDEYRLCVAPVFLGEGGKLFYEGLPYQKLTLLDERRLGNGGVILMYAPAV